MIGWVWKSPGGVRYRAPLNGANNDCNPPDPVIIRNSMLTMKMLFACLPHLKEAIEVDGTDCGEQRHGVDHAPKT